MSRPRQTLHTGLLLLFLSVLITLVTGTTHCCGLFTLPARRLAPAGVTVLGGPKKPNPCFTRGADKHDNINFYDFRYNRDWEQELCSAFVLFIMGTDFGPILNKMKMCF